MVQICLTAIVFVTACTGSPTTVNPEDLPEFKPTQEAYHITFYYSDSGHVRARLQAPHVLEVMDGLEPIQEFDQGIRIDFYTISGDSGSSLRADYAKMYQNKGFARAWGNVVYTGADGARLETNNLTWDQRKDSISTSAPVKITTSKEVLLGDSLVANTQFTWWRIHKTHMRMRLIE